jgi:hypothetical protein
VFDTDDTALINQGAMDEPWQQFIIGGPMTVNLLGQLMVVSSKLDFSFIDISPDYKFTYMKFPQSFRATLTQIANGNLHPLLKHWRRFSFYSRCRRMASLSRCAH